MRCQEISEPPNELCASSESYVSNLLDSHPFSTSIALRQYDGIDIPLKVDALHSGERLPRLVHHAAAHVRIKDALHENL
jgi:hypothetical protein